MVLLDKHSGSSKAKISEDYKDDWEEIDTEMLFHGGLKQILEDNWINSSDAPEIIVGKHNLFNSMRI